MRNCTAFQKVINFDKPILTSLRMTRNCTAYINRLNIIIFWFSEVAEKLYLKFDHTQMRPISLIFNSDWKIPAAELSLEHKIQW